jgi:hypothetical protein
MQEDANDDLRTNDPGKKILPDTKATWSSECATAQDAISGINASAVREEAAL